MEEKDWREYLNYILIALISIVSLTFLPMIGSTFGAEFQFPQTRWELALFSNSYVPLSLYFISFIKKL